MDQFYNRQNFKKILQIKFIATALKSMQKLVKLQNLVAKCFKM